MLNPECQARAKQVSPYAAKYGIDTALLCAVIEQESGWQWWATRYEPLFYARYIHDIDLPMVEARDRATSWGYMQIMGEVARELGYTGALPDLRIPENGLEFGCKKLSRCLAQCSGDVRCALLKYNGGSRIAYADEVLARVPKYTEDK